MVKVCTKCGLEKPFSEFNKMAGGKDGLRPWCRQCSRAWARQYRQSAGEMLRATDRHRWATRRSTANEKARLRRLDNKDVTRRKTREKYLKNRDGILIYQKEYALANKEKIAARFRLYSKRRGAFINARLAAQKKRVRQATVAFSDMKKIRQVYESAAYFSKVTGVEHTVDHVVPITSKLVCGLHVHWNLELMSKSNNSRKGNRHWPDFRPGDPQMARFEEKQ